MDHCEKHDLPERWTTWHESYGWNKTKDEFFDKQTWSKYKNLFIDKKVPLFALTNEKIILNANLKDYRFAKIKDPFTAFQDIMMYISGVLGVGEPEMVEISNNDMRDKKGFDDWSFKKHPDDTKKPRRRGR